MLLTVAIKSVLGLILAPVIVGFIAAFGLYAIFKSAPDSYRCVVPPHHEMPR
jgi:hypothetical protein